MRRSYSRPLALLLLAIALLAVGQYIRVWAAIPSGPARTGDFAGTYAASTLLRTGHGSQLYSEPAEQAVLAATGTPLDHLDIPFENPPAAAVVALPLSLLDSALAYRVWDVLQLLLMVAAAAIAARAAPWAPGTAPTVKLVSAAAAVAGVGTSLLFFEGQWDGVAVLGLAVAYAGWRRGWTARSGFAVGLSAAIAKPHLVLGVLAFMAGRRDWRGLAGAAAGGGVALAISLLAGPGAVLGFVGALLKPSNSPGVVMQSLVGLVESWFGPDQATFLAGTALSAVALAAAAAAGRWSLQRNRFEPALMTAVTLSLLAAPHLLGHDLTLLAPALIGMLAWLTTSETRRVWPGPGTAALLAAWVALSMATQQDLTHVAPPVPGRLTPLALLLLLGTTLAAGRALVRSRSANPAHLAA